MQKYWSTRIIGSLQSQIIEVPANEYAFTKLAVIKHMTSCIAHGFNCDQVLGINSNGLEIMSSKNYMQLPHHENLMARYTKEKCKHRMMNEGFL